jgi:putative flippase GtrA
MEALISRYTARVLRPEHVVVLAQFVRFGTVGAFGFVVDTSVVYATRFWLGLYGAGALAFFVAASANWVLNRVWTFRGRNSGRMHHQWLKFLAANSIGFVLNRGAFFLLVTISPLCVAYPVIAVFAGTLAGMVANFVLSRRLVFR